MRTFVKITVVIMMLSVIILYCVFKLIFGGANPTWEETYSYENDSIIIMRFRGSPSNNAVVVQFTGKTGWHGGWGCPGIAPSNGDQIYGSAKEQFAVRSFVSDSRGRVPFKPFVTEGQGRKGMTGGHTKKGFVKILVYKRGYILRDIPGQVNEVQDSRICISDLHSRSPLEGGVDDVLKLLCPFIFADTAMQRVYWSHVLPNGLTVQDYALNELNAILTTITNEGRQIWVRQVIELIKNENFEGYPTNYHQLTTLSANS